jgi:hypothetical protein
MPIPYHVPEAWGGLGIPILSDEDWHDVLDERTVVALQCQFECEERRRRCLDEGRKFRKIPKLKVVQKENGYYRLGNDMLVQMFGISYEAVPETSAAWLAVGGTKEMLEVEEDEEERRLQNQVGRFWRAAFLRKPKSMDSPMVQCAYDKPVTPSPRCRLTDPVKSDRWSVAEEASGYSHVLSPFWDVQMPFWW